VRPDKTQKEDGEQMRCGIHHQVGIKVSPEAIRQ
jgi:hypothetical protein